MGVFSYYFIAFNKFGKVQQLGKTSRRTDVIGD